MDERRRDARARRRRRLRRRRLGAIAVVIAIGAGTAAIVLAGGGNDRHKQRSQAVPKPDRPKPVKFRATVRHLSLPATLPSRTVDVPILMYHRIDAVKPTLPSVTRALTVDPRDFADQMRWIKTHGFHTVTQEQLFDALERGRPLPPKPVLITFDDGYRDVFGKASTTIKRLGLHATAYVITDRISGPDASFLTWSLLKGLERRGIEIGSHTMTHAELPSLSDSEAMQQLLGSRHVLERKLGHPVQWFSYPAGRADTRTAGLVRKAGYVLAVTTQPGTVQEAAEPLLLHRYEVQDTTGVSGLAAILGS